MSDANYFINRAKEAIAQALEDKGSSDANLILAIQLLNIYRVLREEDIIEDISEDGLNGLLRLAASWGVSHETMQKMSEDVIGPCQLIPHEEVKKELLDHVEDRHDGSPPIAEVTITAFPIPNNDPMDLIWTDVLPHDFSGPGSTCKTCLMTAVEVTDKAVCRGIEPTPLKTNNTHNFRGPKRACTYCLMMQNEVEGPVCPASPRNS